MNGRKVLRRNRDGLRPSRFGGIRHFFRKKGPAPRRGGLSLLGGPGLRQGDPGHRSGRRQDRAPNCMPRHALSRDRLWPRRWSIGCRGLFTTLRTVRCL